MHTRYPANPVRRVHSVWHGPPLESIGGMRIRGAKNLETSSRLATPLISIAAFDRVRMEETRKHCKRTRRQRGFRIVYRDHAGIRDVRRVDRGVHAVGKSGRKERAGTAGASRGSGIGHRSGMSFKPADIRITRESTSGSWSASGYEPNGTGGPEAER